MMGFLIKAKIDKAQKTQITDKNTEGLKSADLYQALGWVVEEGKKKKTQKKKYSWVL